jgi:signal transduction histidine kinase
VDAVARAHGGRVEISDRAEGGAVIVLTLGEAVNEKVGR